MKEFGFFAAASIVAALLTACGGGGSSESIPNVSITHHRHDTAGQITLYALSDGSAFGITAGADGALWAVQTPLEGCPTNSSIAQVATDGTVAEFPLAFCDADSLTTGSDDALWISSNAGVGLALGRFAPGSSGFTDYGTNIPNVGFYGLTAGPDGGLWIAAGNYIMRSDTNGVPINYSLPGQDPGVYNIAAGPDGALWFTDAYNVGQVGRITTGGIITEYQIPTQNPLAAGITAGPDGAMWFVEHNADKVGRIDMNGNITEYPLPSGSGGFGIAAGADGNLWIAENGSNSIGRMTTSGTVTQYPLPGSCSDSCSPFQITAGPDGAMWFTLLYCPSNCYPSVPGYVGRIATDGSPRHRTNRRNTNRLRFTDLRPPTPFGLGAMRR